MRILPFKSRVSCCNCDNEKVVNRLHRCGQVAARHVRVKARRWDWSLKEHDWLTWLKLAWLMLSQKFKPWPLEHCSIQCQDLIRNGIYILEMHFPILYMVFHIPEGMLWGRRNKQIDKDERVPMLSSYINEGICNRNIFSLRLRIELLKRTYQLWLFDCWHW